MEAIYTETKNGITLKILHDDSTMAESPADNDEGVILCYYPKSGAICNGPKAMLESHDLETVEGALAFSDDESVKADWEIFALWIYDHSGLAFRVTERNGSNPFMDRWDSAQAGFIALKRSEFNGDLLKAAEGICETYTQWSNGEIYGYVIEDEEGEHLDSCWGFIGDSDGYVLEQGREMLEHYAADDVTAARRMGQRTASVQRIRAELSELIDSTNEVENKTAHASPENRKAVTLGNSLRAALRALEGGEA